MPHSDHHAAYNTSGPLKHRQPEPRNPWHAAVPEQHQARAVRRSMVPLCVPLTRPDALWVPWHIVAQLNNSLLPITTFKPIDSLCSKRSSNHCSAHLRTQRDAHLLRHAPRDADGRHAPRLRHAHHAALRAAGLEVRFW